MKKGGKVQSTICNKFWIFNKVLVFYLSVVFLICVAFLLVGETVLKRYSPPITDTFFEPFCQKPFYGVTCF